MPRIDFDAAVHSVFDSVVNLKPKGQDQLLTLLAADQPDLPQGVRLDAPRIFSFKALPHGTAVTCRGGRLRFAGYPLTIDLQPAACWDADLPSIQADMRKAEVMAAWHSAWQALNHRQWLYRSELIAADLLSHAAVQRAAWVERASQCMSDIVRATVRCDAGLSGSVQGLVGLGPGLTPGGDDLIAGYLIGLWRTTRGQQERLHFLSELGALVIRLCERTNDISRTYLFHAAGGRASSRLIDLVSTICSAARQADVVTSAELAMQVGHTSGMDTVTGLLLGLAAWDAPLLPGTAPRERAQAH